MAGTKKTGTLWLVLALCTAISRIGVGVHYPFDVLTGALLGILAALTVSWLTTRFHFTHQLLYFYEKGEQIFLPAKNQSKDA